MIESEESQCSQSKKWLEGWVELMHKLNMSCESNCFKNEEAHKL